MNESTRQKIREEKPLNALETFELERRLEDQERSGLSLLAGRQPEVEPSLAWRSALNQKLLESAPARPKKRWFLAAGFGVPALAGALALTMLLANPKQPTTPVAPKGSSWTVAQSSAPSGSDLEGQIVLIHSASESLEEAAIAMPEESGAYQWDTLGKF